MFPLLENFINQQKSKKKSKNYIHLKAFQKFKF